MELSGDRLLLRDFTPDDGAAFAAYHADPRYLEFYEPGVDRPEHATALVERFIAWSAEHPRRNFQLAIVERDPRRLIGCGGLRTRGLPAGRAEFGLELAPSRWGHGLAGEAARALLDFGFRSLGLAEIRGESVTQNVRVATLVRKLGFVEVHTRPGAPWMDAKGWTRTEWRLTRSAWRSGPDGA